jgi:lysozyme
MTKLAQVAATPSVNAGMKMSPEVRGWVRRSERDVFKYYDDMGAGKGCTLGPSILAHRGPCNREELARPVSAAAVEAEFARRVV